MCTEDNTSPDKLKKMARSYIRRLKHPNLITLLDFRGILDAVNWDKK